MRRRAGQGKKTILDTSRCERLPVRDGRSVPSNHSAHCLFEQRPERVRPAPPPPQVAREEGEWEGQRSEGDELLDGRRGAEADGTDDGSRLGDRQEGRAEVGEEEEDGGGGARREGEEGEPTTRRSR